MRLHRQPPVTCNTRFHHTDASRLLSGQWAAKQSRAAASSLNVATSSSSASISRTRPTERLISLERSSALESTRHIPAHIHFLVKTVTRVLAYSALRASRWFQSDNPKPLFQADR